MSTRGTGFPGQSSTIGECIDIANDVAAIVAVLLDAFEHGDDRHPHHVPDFHRARFCLATVPAGQIDHAGSAVMIGAEFELAPLRVPEGLILYLKHTETPWTVRIVPIRDPDQPRLWCLRMEACAGPSLTAKTARIDPYYTSLALTREQLGGILQAIRERPAAWIEEPDQGDFRRWLKRVVAMPIPDHFTSQEPPPRPNRRTSIPAGVQVDGADGGV